MGVENWIWWNLTICNFYQIFLQRFYLGELVYERYKKLVQNIWTGITEGKFLSRGAP